MTMDGTTKSKQNNKRNKDENILVCDRENNIGTSIKLRGIKKNYYII